MPTTKVQCTKNYRLFERHVEENRPINMKKHRKLLESMKLYGWLRSFPMGVTRNSKGHLIVKDGQHRLAIAESLGIAVWFIIEEVDYDVAKVNSAQEKWVLSDYAQKHMANGLKEYAVGMEFAQSHGLSIGTAFALLAGTTSFGNCDDAFYNGTWKVKDRPYAEAVAGIYGPLIRMAPVMKNSRLVEACMAVCRVDAFEPKRLLSNAERCREKLVNYSTRDAYLDMMELVYNFGRAKLVGLKSLAVMVMRDRNATTKAAVEKRKKAA